MEYIQSPVDADSYKCVICRMHFLKSRVSKHDRLHEIQDALRQKNAQIKQLKDEMYELELELSHL